MRRLVTRRRRDEPTRVGPIAREGWLRGKRWRCCATVATGSGGGRGGSGIGQIFLFAVRGLLSARRDEAGVDARLSRLQQLLMTGWRDFAVGDGVWRQLGRLRFELLAGQCKLRLLHERVGNEFFFSSAPRQSVAGGNRMEARVGGVPIDR